MTEYWWFSATNHKLGYGDGRKAAIGVTHAVAGPIELCEKGLHASPTALDALQYASGPCAWLVGLGGSILDGGDKSCAAERTYIAGGVDTTEVLRAFARRVALDVAHLWSMPDEVRAYLETGDESMSAAASAAAWAAAGTAARDAARAAAGDAARDAAWGAASAAAWTAARAAAGTAAGTAARAATRAAARDAARDATWAAAWAAAREKYAGWLDEMLRAAIKMEG